MEPPAELAKLLVTLFQELRAGMTKDGNTKIKPPSTVLSTAEAISVLFSSTILAQHFGKGKVTPADLLRSLFGTVQKENPEDLKVVREYCETVAKNRGGPWKEFYTAARSQLRERASSSGFLSSPFVIPPRARAPCCVRSSITCAPRSCWSRVLPMRRLSSSSWSTRKP